MRITGRSALYFSLASLEYYHLFIELQQGSVFCNSNCPKEFLRILEKLIFDFIQKKQCYFLQHQWKNQYLANLIMVKN
jgi:hypothetical protein